MAQSGFTQIQLYSSPTPGATPAASNLTNGELAINAADGKLFYKDTGGNTQVIADSAYSNGFAVKGSGTNVVATGTVEFANSNGVTFGLNGSTMTASVVAGVDNYNIISAGGNTAGTLATFSSGTVVLAGGSNITLSQNSNTISINAGPAPITVSAGTTSIATNNIVFASSSGVSFNVTSNSVVQVPYYTSYNQARLLNQATFSIVPFNIAATSATATSNIYLYGNYVMSLDRPLIFSKIQNKIIYQTVTNANAVVAVYRLTASTNNDLYGFTQALDYFNIFYTKTGDTLNSYTSVNFPMSISGAASASAGAGSSITQSFSVIYPYTTDSNGYIYSTLSTSLSTSAVSATGSSINVTWPSSNLSAAFSNLAGQQVIQKSFVTPVTLQSGTYVVVNGVSTLSSFSNTSALSMSAGATAQRSSGIIVNLNNISGYGVQQGNFDAGGSLAIALVSKGAFNQVTYNFNNYEGQIPLISSFNAAGTLSAATITGYKNLFVTASSSSYPLSIFTQSQNGSNGTGINLTIPLETFL